ncbi:MAG: DAPG hydrolase family protein [Desulfopila sp.]
MTKKVPVSSDDRQKSYFKYYDMKMAEPDRAVLDRITREPCSNDSALRIENRNDLFLPGELPGEFGWWLLEDGTATIANRTFFPGVTGEMFDWWFAWHPIDRLRYAIWDSEDHADVQLADPARARDMSLSMQERHWGSVHRVWEDIGTGMDLLEIRFKKPSEMGYDMEKIGTTACNALVCANCSILGHDDIGDGLVVMTHFLRPVTGGSELRSRFWFGWQIVDGKAVKCIPDGVRIPAIAPLSLLQHNVKEFSNLVQLLPQVYAEEKDNWF